MKHRDEEVNQERIFAVESLMVPDASIEQEAIQEIPLVGFDQASVSTSYLEAVTSLLRVVQPVKSKNHNDKGIFIVCPP